MPIRYIRVEKNLAVNGEWQMHFAELEAFNLSKVNVALNKPTTASSEVNDSLKEHANDGITTGNSIWQSNNDTNGSWWEVDLESEQDIASVKIYNRSDNIYYESLLGGSEIKLLSGDRTVEHTFVFNYNSVNSADPLNSIQEYFTSPLEITSISMENIINPSKTGEFIVTFNQSISQPNLNAYISLNPEYIGTFGDITSSDGNLTYTGTLTLNDGINRINNSVSVNYNGVIGEAYYDVVESDGLSITNAALVKEYIDDTITKRFVSKISRDGSHIGVIDLKSSYNTLSTIIYEYDSNTNDYIQKGSILKTGSVIELSNDGTYVLIGKSTSGNYYDMSVYYYKYNATTLDWDLVNEIVGIYHDNKGVFLGISMDGSGKKFVLSRFYRNTVYNYNDVNNTLSGTLVSETPAYGKLSNDGNVLYLIDGYFNLIKYSYDGNNWVIVYNKTIEGNKISQLGEAGINNLERSVFNISNDGNILAITGSRIYVPSGEIDINGNSSVYTNKTIILEFDEINNDFSLKGNIINHELVGDWVIKSIDITGDGNRIVVGDTGMQHGNNATSQLEGKVEIYDYNNVSNNWDLYHRILGGGGEKDNFGDNVSITSDGTKITGTNHNKYDGWKYSDTNYNTNNNILQEYTRIYSLERGIERLLISMSMSDTIIKFPETGGTFEVKFSTNNKTIEDIQGNITLEPIGEGSLTNVVLGNNGFSLVGIYNAPTQTESTGNKLKYNEGNLSGEVPFTLSTSEKAISNICFYGEAKVLMSDGYVELKNVIKGMQIQGKYIEEVTRTISKEKEVVLIKKGSIMKGMPFEDTRITKEHKVLYKGKLVEAKKLVNGINIVYEEYKGATLYNIMMKGEGKMVVNGMIVETLSPSNNIAKLYKIMKGYNEKEKLEIIRIFNENKQSMPIHNNNNIKNKN